MYNNLLKSGNVIKHDEARVIDSNSKIAERLQFLSEMLQGGNEDEFYDDFSAGLDAVQVEHLIGETDAADALFEDQQQPAAPSFDTEAFERMKMEATAEADSILAAAREEAEGILAAANEEAQAIRSKAQADGHDEGYNQGYDEGLQIAREAEEKSAQRQYEL